MSKQKKTIRSTKRGPFLTAALFCERTLQEKEDDTISVVRMFDRLTLQLGPDAPEGIPSEEQRLPVSAAALVAFKSGDFPGKATVRLVMESPSGKKNPLFKQEIILSDGPNGGANLRLNFTLGIASTGIFLMHVYLNDKRYTSVPLEIVVERNLGPLNGKSS